MNVKKNELLGTAPLPKLFVSMALPSILAQLINILYSMVDRIYIGKLGTGDSLALTGVGVTFPIIMIISAFSAFTGQGGAPLASISLGENNHKKAEKILGNSFILLIIFSIILTIFFQIFKVPILYKFGASDNTIGYALEYIDIYIWGSIFVMLALGLNTFISGQGESKIAMFSVVIGAVTNIILDPIFIFYFDMGVRGAAWATVISQFLSALWVVQFLFSKKSVIKIKKENFKLDFSLIKTIISLGSSSFVMQSTESIVLLTLNKGLAQYGGDIYIGTLVILYSVLQLIIIPVNGFSQGIQPIISYNYGAGNKDRVLNSFKGLLVISTIFTLIMGGLGVLFPQIYISLFSNGKNSISILTSSIMPIYLIGMCFFGIQQAIQGTFLALGQAKYSITIAILRKIIFIIPLSILLPNFIGVNGIYFAEPISDILSITIASLIFYNNYKKILKL